MLHRIRNMSILSKVFLFIIIYFPLTIGVAVLLDKPRSPRKATTTTLTGCDQIEYYAKKHNMEYALKEHLAYCVELREIKKDLQKVREQMEKHEKP